MGYRPKGNDVLNLSNQSIKKVPKSILKNLNIIELDLSKNELTELPEFISKLKNLKVLKLRNNKFKIAPEIILQLKNLKTLSLSENQITVIPESFSRLSKLEEFDIGGNPLIEFPNWINKLYSLKDLGIYELKLKHLPDVVTQLRYLEVISLDDNDLVTLPDSIENLKYLKEFWAAANKFEYIPESFGNLSNLKRINFWDNKIKCLPESICNLRQLVSLGVCENNLKELPNNIGNLSSLTSLDISYNLITTLPKSFSSLNIRKLDVGFEGNFYTEATKREIKRLFPDIEDSELELDISCEGEEEIPISKIQEAAPIEISKGNLNLLYLIGVIFIVIACVFYAINREDPETKAYNKSSNEYSRVLKLYKEKRERALKSNNYLYVYTNDKSELKAFLDPNIDFYSNPYVPIRSNIDSKTEAFKDFLNDKSSGFNVLLDNKRVRLIQSIILDTPFTKESVKEYSLVVDYKMTKKEIEIKKKHLNFKSVLNKDIDSVFNTEKIILTSKELESRKIKSNIRYLLAPAIDLDNEEYHFYFSSYNNNCTKQEFIKAIEDFKIMFLKEDANKNIGVIKELKIEL